VPIVIRAPSGGGIHGGPFHSQNPEAWFAHVPGLKVVTPGTAHDAKGLIKAAIRDNDPVLFFEHKALYRRIKDDVPEGDYTIPIGKASIFRSGTDLSIITYGSMVYVARDAAELLEKEGISVEILDLRTVLPLDEEAILASARKTSKVILLHEDILSGGVGGEIAARIAEKAFDALDGPVVRIAAADTPVPYSPPLEEAFLPNVPRVVEKARWLHRY
jgi:2-oxoisovalerate dehydrogenase E1 component beta subunit